jgi:L-2-hydroxyglutarate oxidase
LVIRIKPEAKIVPFRGEYYELVSERRHLVNTLIYPVPNLAFPFLGVHFTKMIDGPMRCSPLSERDIFWKLARKHMNDGLMEIYRSLSKKAFVRSLQELVPELTEADVISTHAGVRAQVLRSDGGMVDGFLIIKDRSAIHVCSAPSPAATASLEIGRAISTFRFIRMKFPICERTVTAPGPTR